MGMERSCLTHHFPWLQFRSAANLGQLADQAGGFAAVHILGTHGSIGRLQVRADLLQT